MSSKKQHSNDGRGDDYEDQWDACPPGELSKMVHRLDASQYRARNQQVIKTALISSAVFACVVLALGSLAGPRGAQFGGINCDFCRSHMAEYQPHAAGEVVHQDTDFISSMKTHLEHCPICREKFNAMYPEQSLSMAYVLHPMFATGQISSQW